MNIGPTQVAPLAAENPASAEPVRQLRKAPSPASEDVPKAENRGAESVESRAQASQEVVRVRPDTSTGQQILVYEFVDSHSGSLIFQVPSEQMLNLVQEIRRRLEKMAGKEPGEAKAGG